MNTHDCVKSCTDRVDIGLLAVLVPSACVQDVPSVQNQDQHMDLGWLQTLLGWALLRSENLKFNKNYIYWRKSEEISLLVDDNVLTEEKNQNQKFFWHQTSFLVSDLWLSVSMSSNIDHTTNTLLFTTRDGQKTTKGNTWITVQLQQTTTMPPEHMWH